MQQVIVIHGGDSFTTRREYLRFLRSFKISNPALKQQRGWKANLQTDLGRGWTVVQPAMPNKLNARYDEWKLWFEKYRPYIKPNAVFIGHSLGGIFLAKYFSEHRWPNRFKAIILVAAPYADTRSLVDFRIQKPLHRLARQAKRIFLFASTDDPVVPWRDAQRYARQIPSAEVQSFQRKGHFNQPHFRELVRLLKTL